MRVDAERIAAVDIVPDGRVRKIFVLIPSPHPTGPVKGAYALAKALARQRDVTLVTLKPGPGILSSQGDDVIQRSLAKVNGGWKGWVEAYRGMLQSAGGREKVASISLCLSADMVNRFCSRQAVICSSVRANLLQSYRMDYGLVGVPLAVAHLAALARFDHIVAMTQAMADQIERYARKAPAVIGNFVDEEGLEPYRVLKTAKDYLHFVFIGSLTSRKQPSLLINAIQRLVRRGVDLRLDIVGDGPLRQRAMDEVARLSLDHVIRLHGQLADPYSILAQADAMVLPSLSEGVSRAALEALHLGVPCVLRDVDGNRELLHSGYNGELFLRDDELPDAMLSAATLGRAAPTRECLLRRDFRQSESARKYLHLVEQN